ncbi:MAG: UvrD-helicase domain-containing protein [Methanoregulaceae archaeon]|nr:UvrD-helicase domain-containing protein [Methanoregulaceae archaeon]
MAATRRQNEAISTHDRSLVVTAGAGTGKTYVLVQKYLDLLETRGVTVPEILALTFTEKAAAEMKERIRRALSGKKGERWERAAVDFLVAPVQTFHSFCAQVLREFPIESGLEPGFVVLDERQVSRLHGKTFEDLVHVPSPPPVHDAVVRILSVFEPSTVRAMLAEMYGKRLSYRQFFEALGSDRDPVIRTWTREVNSVRENGIRDLQNDRSFNAALTTLFSLANRYEGADDKAVCFLCGIRPLLDAISGDSDIEVFCSAATDLLTKRPGNAGSRKVWKGNDLSLFKSAYKELNDILKRKSSLFRMTVDPADPLVTGAIDLLGDLSLVYHRYTELVEREKAVLGGLDFEDLILHARQLFLTNEDLVATHFLPRFRYILIDEFQDTDPSQFDIILAIIGIPSPSTDCLFIVGDPKQSIYLFRDADVTRFKAVREIILTQCQGREVHLDTSFRSTKEVIGGANYLFSRLFASAEKPWEFGYEPILVSEARAGDAGSFELLLPPPGEDSAATKWIEADMVARRIQSLVHGCPVRVYEEAEDRSFISRPARYSDIAILLEQRTNLSLYIAALARYGIPFYVHGGTGFYSRQEVYDLYNLLRFLHLMHDDISLAGTLRSPYCGLPDTDLFRIGREKGRTFWEKLQNYGEQTGSEGAVRACRLLSLWRADAGRTGIVPLIRRILSESGIYTVYAALPEGKQVLANLEKIVAMARVREGAGSYGLADFIEDLRTAMDEEEREGEAPLDALAENSVNVMTVHAAKGLEFPIVVVPDMGMQFRETFPPIMIGDNPLLVGITVPDPEGDFELTKTPMLLALREMRRQKERAEKKRLLYVALTRARDHLIMSGSPPANPDLSIRLATSRIEWLFSALGITDDAIAAGGMDLVNGDDSIHLTITTDPAAIPAEAAKSTPELLVVPEECAGKGGTWSPKEFDKGPEGIEIISVTDLEREHSSHSPSACKTVQSRYLPGVDGPLKGTIIHEVLRDRDPRIVCREYGVNYPEAPRQCEAIVARFHSSPLMQRVKREFCELPFVITYDGRHVKGKIDRLCELVDGSWVLIDYKSDPVDPSDYVKKAEEYQTSMDVYVEAARQLVKRNEVEGYLYFTETGDFLRVMRYEEAN